MCTEFQNPLSHINLSINYFFSLQIPFVPLIGFLFMTIIINLLSLSSLCGFKFLLLLPYYCMAKSKSSNFLEISTKPQFTLLCFTLLFIFLISADSLNPSMASTQSLNSHSSSTSTMNLNPRNSPTSSSSHPKEFEADAHEVPSGPNPISNR